MEIQSRESSSLPLLTQQLDETEKAINNMLNAIQQGILTSSTKKRLDELEEMKSNIEINILQEQMQKPLLTREQLTFWIHRFRKTNITILEQRQRLIDIFVNSVYVFDDHAVVTFNYRDGTKTITLDELKSTGLCSDLKGFGVPDHDNRRYQMEAVRAYYDGSVFIPIEPVKAKKNQNALITIIEDAKREVKPHLRFIGILSAESYDEIITALKDTQEVDVDE